MVLRVYYTHFVQGTCKSEFIRIAVANCDILPNSDKPECTAQKPGGNSNESYLNISRTTINLFPLDDIMVCSIEGEIVSLKIRSSFQGTGSRGRGKEGKQIDVGKEKKRRCNKKCEVLWRRLRTLARTKDGKRERKERVRSTSRDNCNYIAKLSWLSFIGPLLPSIFYDLLLLCFLMIQLTSFPFLNSVTVHV
jgi:hypothetical protein